MHLIFFFFYERSLSKDVAFRVDIRIIIYIKMLQKKIEQNLVRKNMKSFSRVRQQKKRNKVEKERNKNKEVIKRESDSRQGELVLFSVDKPTTKKEVVLLIIGQVSLQLVGGRLRRHGPEKFHYDGGK